MIFSNLFGKTEDRTLDDLTPEDFVETVRSNGSGGGYSAEKVPAMIAGLKQVAGAISSFPLHLEELNSGKWKIKQGDIDRILSHSPDGVISSHDWSGYDAAKSNPFWQLNKYYSHQTKTVKLSLLSLVFRRRCHRLPINMAG